MDTRIIKSWLRFIEPVLHRNQVTTLVVLGYGSGEPIFELQKKYPDIDLIVVDPRKENFKHNYMQACGPLQYVSNKQGVWRLQKVLQQSSSLIPMVEFRPSWDPHVDFFIWSEAVLKETTEVINWSHQPSHFILQSLFV